MTCQINQSLFRDLAVGEARETGVGYFKLYDAARDRGLRILTITTRCPATGERRRVFERLPAGETVTRAFAALRRRRRRALRTHELEKAARWRALTRAEQAYIDRFHAGERWPHDDDEPDEGGEG